MQSTFPPWKLTCTFRVYWAKHLESIGKKTLRRKKKHENLRLNIKAEIKLFVASPIKI